ncbi:MAG TPA: hypothetical protein DCX54_04620 [Flavobacteriales bacterium]|nr:hypothetical protein [Flavobacteriales bacterium]
MKKNTASTKTISVFLVVLILFSSCASTTVIESVPTGAKLYVDGQPCGLTPYSYSDTKIVGSTTRLRLNKEGYEEMNVTFSRDEQADAGAIIAGVFVWVPFLWTMKYNPTHIYELEPVDLNKGQNDEVQIPFNSSSKGDRLRELKKLLDDGILTQEEFEKEKQKILAEDD